MSTLRVTGVQMIVDKSKKNNLPKMLNYIKNSDADIILFPEMSLTGYHDDFSDARTEEAWQEIAAACRVSYTTAIIGTGIRHDGHTHIQSRIYSDAGELVGSHEKLVPTSGDREWCRPGEELNTFTVGDVTYGCLICNDLWVTPGCGPYPDPRLSFQLGHQGAQVIFHSANSGVDQEYLDWHEVNLRMRAKESKLYIVTVNAASADSPINSYSGIVSPDGKWLVRTSLQGEQTFTYDIEFE